MSMIRLIHISPELPPVVGGVADYTAILSRRLVEISDGSVKPVLVHAGKEHVDQIEVDFPVENLSGRCSSKALAEAIRRLDSKDKTPTVVLLEYSGYGYSGHGAPFWLAEGLRHVCGTRGIPLITIFHELYASSYKPWDARFWMMPMQRYVTGRLASISDGCTSNWDAAARWLERRQVDGKPVRISPTFSNVGEPESLPNYNERKSYAVCFGGAGRKEEMYRQYGQVLSEILYQIGIEEIVDLGPSPRKSAYAEIGISVNPKGIRPESEISSRLMEASLGILKHNLHCLKKSGVWASYAAHGLPTLICGERETVEELQEGKHFSLANSEMQSTSGFPLISKEVYKWYSNSAHSERAARCVCEIASVLIEDIDRAVGSVQS